MTAKVSFDEKVADDQFVLPSAAVYQTNDNPSVWVVRDNHAQLVPVQVKGYNDNNVIISSGLNKGDVVITAGIAKLVPDQEVRLAEGGEQ
ncbi:RND family efflux transporter MFP subunit [gut metagenome]|uniref:RND family efflux transporter MFP subunit n=1 Tax=gut metagenome TaxID=749906 RepID=J9GX78_9ZZZZ